MGRHGVMAVLGAALLAVSAAGCREDPGPLVRDHYASLADCVADWGRVEQCDRIQSSGYAEGGMVVYRGPAYPENGRAAALGESRAGARSAVADASRQGRAIGTVREPVAREAPAPRRNAPSDAFDDADAISVADSLAGLPVYVAHFGIALMLLTLALAVYVALAARHEMRLLREGNAAVAAGMAGVFVGFALPLASAMFGTETLLDLLVWAAAALTVQLLVLLGVRLALGALAQRMRDGQVASGVFLGAVAVVLGLMNAASLVIGL